jgi:hypothetical protein
MPYAPDMTIRGARPERYNATARRARVTVAGRGCPQAVMPPPRATITSALAKDTAPTLLGTPPAAQPPERVVLPHEPLPDSDLVRPHICQLRDSAVSGQM